MADTKPRLIILTPSAPDTDEAATPPPWTSAIADRFTIIVTPSLDDPAVQGGVQSDDLVMIEGSGVPELALGTEAMLQRAAEGAALIGVDGSVIWQDDRFASYGSIARDAAIDQAMQACALLNVDGELETPWTDRRSRSFSFFAEARHYELLISPAGSDPKDERRVHRVVVLMWENTATRRMQDRVDSIDAAGAELLAIDANTMRNRTLTERLSYLEERIAAHVRNVLNFDDFEIRLIDRESNRLDLVMSEGLTPLKIGEVIFAEAQGNGISGYVAATGESYLCDDVSGDPLYREGLDNAASSLTVPLRINERVIGVFNIEANSKNAFNDDDRVCAELFGRYIAMAMNIFDIMVAERTTTSQEASKNIRGELVEPIKAIKKTARQLRKLVPAEREIRAKINEIIRTAENITDRIECAVTGPRTILETEQELHRANTDPIMRGRRIIIADDEPAIREGLEMILTQRGCEVTVVTNGLECIEVLEKARRRRQRVDVVLSDIRMPERNGYEVFRAAKELHPRAEVILMTGFGYDPHHSIVRSSQEGLHSFLFKPFKASQMIAEVSKALASPGKR